MVPSPHRPRRQRQSAPAAPVSIEKKGKKRTLEEEIEACTSEDPDSNDRFWFQSPDIPVDPKKRDEMLARYEKDTRAALISANKRRDADDKVCSRFVPAHAVPFTAILRLQRHRQELEELRIERQRLISQQKQQRPEKTASPIPDLDLKRLISSKVM